MKNTRTAFSSFQLFALCSVSTGLGTICFAPFFAGGADAGWVFAVLITAAVSAAVTGLYMRLISKSGAGSFGELVGRYLPLFLSKPILAAAGLFFALQASLSGFIAAETAGSYLLERTPRGAILLLLTITASFVCSSGLRYSARCCELLLLLLALPLGVLLTVCIFNADIGESATLLTPSSYSVFGQLPSALISLPAAAAIVFASGNKARDSRGVFLGFWASAAVSILLYACTAGLFTADGAAAQKFPFVEMTRSVSIGGISLTERFDTIFISIMLIAALLQIALLGSCACHCLSACFSLREECFAWLLLPVVFVCGYYAEERIFADILMQISLRGTLFFLLTLAPIIAISLRLGRKGADSAA